MSETLDFFQPSRGADHPTSDLEHGVITSSFPFSDDYSALSADNNEDDGDDSVYLSLVDGCTSISTTATAQSLLFPQQHNDRDDQASHNPSASLPMPSCDFHATSYAASSDMSFPSFSDDDGASLENIATTLASSIAHGSNPDALGLPNELQPSIVGAADDHFSPRTRMFKKLAENHPGTPESVASQTSSQTTSGITTPPRSCSLPPLNVKTEDEDEQLAYNLHRHHHHHHRTYVKPLIEEQRKHCMLQQTAQPVAQFIPAVGSENSCHFPPSQQSLLAATSQHHSNGSSNNSSNSNSSSNMLSPDVFIGKGSLNALSQQTHLGSTSALPALFNFDFVDSAFGDFDSTISLDINRDTTATAAHSYGLNQLSQGSLLPRHHRLAHNRYANASHGGNQSPVLFGPMANTPSPFEDALPFKRPKLSFNFRASAITQGSSTQTASPTTAPGSRNGSANGTGTRRGNGAVGTSATTPSTGRGSSAHSSVSSMYSSPMSASSITPTSGRFPMVGGTEPSSGPKRQSSTSNPSGKATAPLPPPPSSSAAVTKTTTTTTTTTTSAPVAGGRGKGKRKASNPQPSPRATSLNVGLSLSSRVPHTMMVSPYSYSVPQPAPSHTTASTTSAVTTSHRGTSLHAPSTSGLFAAHSDATGANFMQLMGLPVTQLLHGSSNQNSLFDSAADIVGSNAFSHTTGSSNAKKSKKKHPQKSATATATAPTTSASSAQLMRKASSSSSTQSPRKPGKGSSTANSSGVHPTKQPKTLHKSHAPVENGVVCPVCKGLGRNSSKRICGVCYSGLYNDITKVSRVGVKVPKGEGISDEQRCQQLCYALKNHPRGCKHNYSCSSESWKFDLAPSLKCTRCRSIQVVSIVPGLAVKIMDTLMHGIEHP